jgi:hypothetical protein
MVLVISIVLLVLGYAIAAWGPKYGVLERLGCRSGSSYYTHIHTYLCGDQYDVCVSFDNNCGNDYHPEKVMRYYSVYGGAALFLGLLGFIGLILGIVILARRR